MQHKPNAAEVPFFDVTAPAKWHVPALFNSPHSGSVMPPEFLALTKLGPAQLRQSEDYLVDVLFSGCVSNGAPLLRASASRAWLDLNREPYELDSRMFHENLPGFMNVSSPRVAAGFGTIPRFVGEGLEIYCTRLPLAEAQNRIESYYKPFHRLLTGLLNECYGRCGFVLLIDCHSMPAAEGAARRGQPDIVLGDRFGASCGGEITGAVESFFTNRGLRVVRNKPYAGGFITEAYGSPHQNRHALQIEINRGLYMDERRRCRTPGFAPLKKVLDEFASALSQMLTGAIPLPWQQAAE